MQLRQVIYGAVAGLCFIFSTLAVQAQGQGRIIPGRYIVALRGDATPAAVAARHGATADVEFDTFRGFAGAVPAGRLRALQNDPRVRWIEPDRVVSLVVPMGKVAPTPPLPGPEITPTGVNRTDAELHSSTNVSAIGIAVIDTGVDLKHPDLNVAGSVSFVPGARSATDDNGHGSHVAGIAAAKRNSGGVRGVAPNARIFAVKVLDSTGNGNLSWIISGVDWVTKNAATKGIKIANMSLGGAFSSPSFDAAIQKSVDAGVTYVVAAGNSASNAATFSPANHPAVITVSAIADSDGAPGGYGAATGYGADDTLATFSNFGAVIEIAAPGVNIYSTYKAGGYATMSGTSMAAPHVAGAAAQLLATNPALKPADIKSLLPALATPQSPVAPTADSTGRLRGGFSGDTDGYAEPLLDAAGL